MYLKSKDGIRNGIDWRSHGNGVNAGDRNTPTPSKATAQLLQVLGNGYPRLLEYLHLTQLRAGPFEVGRGHIGISDHRQGQFPIEVEGIVWLAFIGGHLAADILRIMATCGWIIGDGRLPAPKVDSAERRRWITLSAEGG